MKILKSEELKLLYVILMPVVMIGLCSATALQTIPLAIVIMAGIFYFVTMAATTMNVQKIHKNDV